MYKVKSKEFVMGKKRQKEYIPRSEQSEELSTWN